MMWELWIVGEKKFYYREMGVCNMKKLKKAVESMFIQWCKVWEWEEERKPWGETRVVKKEPPKEFCCRVCRVPKVAEERAYLPTVTEQSSVLLFPKEESIAGGSFVTVEMTGGAISFICGGQMVCYETHNEIALLEREVL